ncbi:MAG: TonB-dependent receptor [Segetibacter sp.]|nr:TonB-dependent receptor [Segetibacter sp.]
MKKRVKILLVLIAPLFAINVSAQQELDPVTITASIQPVSASATGRNILIIKGEQFSKLPVNSIDELLRYLPGIEVQMRGPMGAQSDIVMRGGTFQQVLVIIDGIRINDPNTGHFNSYIPIAPGEISRIEILKGASSAIYGSEAVGGVIHIITKTFAAKKGQESKQLSAQSTIGEYGLWNAQSAGFYSKGNTSIAGGLLTNNAEGQPQRGTRGFFNNTTASVSLKQYLNEDWSIAIRSAYDKRDFAAQNFYTTFASDTATEKVTSNWNHLRLAYAKDKQSFSFDAGYKTVNDQYRFSPVAIANSNKSRLLQGLAVYNWRPSEKTALSTGAQYVNKKISSNDRGNHELDQVGTFVLLNQRIGQNLYINPALRLDWMERTGWEVVPQINVSYKVKDFVVRASAGRTTRDADFTERFNNYNKTLVTGGSIGNPDLEPEQSFSYEAGADYLGIKNLKIATTFFERYHDQLIDYVVTPYSEMPRQTNLIPTGKYALAKNIGEVKTQGVELDVQYSKPLENQQQLWTSLGLTLLNSESDNGTPSFYLSSHAKFLANASIHYTISRFTISANGVYKERQQQAAAPINAAITPHYFVFNLRGQVMFFKNTLGAFVQLDNVFDERYSDLLGSQMPGRWLMGGLKLSL